MGTTTRGRQAEAAVNDVRVLDAARDVFATGGYDAPVAAVAAAAGVGIASLYRRYGSKDELLADVCLRSMRELSELAAAPGGGSPAERLDAFVLACVGARCGALGGIAGRIPVTAEMIAAAQRSQRRVGRLLAAAKRDGVRDDVTVVDILRLIELFSRAPRDIDVSGRLVAVALAGLRTAAGPALPGPPATLASYTARWGR